VKARALITSLLLCFPGSLASPNRSIPATRRAATLSDTQERTIGNRIMRGGVR
jgi:hypothetical protein